MQKNRLFPVLAVTALVGLAACGGEVDDADVVDREVITTEGTEMVEVPVTDTAVVTTEMDVDTAVDVDTTMVGEGEADPAM